MDPLTMGIGMGAQVLGGYLGGKAQDKAQRKALQAQRLATAEAIKRLQEIGLPTEEAQKIVLEQPELVGELVAEQLGDTALADIQLDPTYKEAQMDALRQLQTMGEEGLGLEDRIAFDQMMRDVESSEQSRQKGLLQAMAQRGTLDSGASLIQQLQSSGDATQRAQQQAEALALQAAQGRRDAIAQAAQQARGMESAEYGRGRDLGSARDEIERANLRNRQNISAANLAEKQRIAEAGVDTRNKQQYLNRDLARTLYEDKMQRAKDLNAYTMGQANTESAYQQNKGQRRADQYSGMGSFVGKGIANPKGLFGLNAEDKKES